MSVCQHTEGIGSRFGGKEENQVGNIQEGRRLLPDISQLRVCWMDQLAFNSPLENLGCSHVLLEFKQKERLIADNWLASVTFAVTQATA